MRILYISYWSLNEPLTSSAIFPYLKILDAYESIEHITLVTIERGNENFPDVHLNFKKVTHHPIRPRFRSSFLFSKIDEFTRLPNELTKLARNINADLILAKASFAGSLAYLVHRRISIPFIVESFEPHSDYMVECGEWKKNGFLDKYAKYYERKQLKYSKLIITVTNNYKNYLIETKGVPENKIKVIPSITEIEKFSFNKGNRDLIRNKFELGDDVTGIYVGKFGGLYYNAEAYDIFKAAYGHFDGKMKFFILSPEPTDVIYYEMSKRGIEKSSVHALLASHNDVPKYLSASDFAFSTVKPAFSKQFQCPIKNGEYWANGLPILMTYGIADDYKIIEQGEGGALYDLSKNDLTKALVQIQNILEDPDHREQIGSLAVKYKSIEIAENIYEDIF